MSEGDPTVKNPFKGLHYYTEEDRELFFGRERETEALLRLVDRDILTVLFARSGLGKTSLLRAGLMKHLRDRQLLPVILRIDYSDDAPPPAAQIISATLAAAAEADVEVDATDCSGLLDAPPTWDGTLWELFHGCRFWSLRNDPVRPIAILDQFEELFTLGRTSPRIEAFLTELADLVENRMPRKVRDRLERDGERVTFDTRAEDYKLILALREDYVAKLDSLRPQMPSVMRNRFPLAPLDRERALDVVHKAGGHWITSEVARAIVAAVAGDDVSAEGEQAGSEGAGEIEPAYLSVMCDELFRRMTEQHKDAIDLDLVRTERGSILDALYQRSFVGMDPSVRIFVEDRLLTEGGFRGSVPVAEAGREGIAYADLECLVDSRLLRFESRLGTTHVELSHDLLTPIVRKSRDARRAEAETAQRRSAERRRADELADRLHRVRQRLWTSIAVAALLLLVTGVYLFGWVIPDYTYCNDFTKRLGAPYPVGTLSATAAAHRQSTIRLTSKGWFGPVRTMEIVDASGRLTVNVGIGTYLAAPDAGISRRPARFEYVYDRDGRIVYEVAFDRLARMVWGQVYAPGGSERGQPRSWYEVAIDRLARMIGGLVYAPGDSDRGQPQLAKAMFLGLDGLPQPQSHSRAEFVEIRYDAAGFETEMRYLDKVGNPAPGPDDVYGQRREYDEKGREIRRTSLDRQGKPTIDAAGNAGLELVYDEQNNVREHRAFDSRNEATLVVPGYYRVVSKFDQWGRETERRHFGLAGEAVRESEETGAHLVTWEYDERGNSASIKLYDISDQPIVGGSGMWDFPAHEQRASYDARNRVEQVVYFDESGHPQTGPGGWHGERLEYDANGFISAISYFDANDEPAAETTTGVYRWERTNDSLGQPTEEHYYGTNHQPVVTKDGGYHMRRNEYDKAGNMTAQSYFDAAGEPVPVQIDGAYRVEWDYDRFGNATETRYLDAKGRPMDSKGRFHRIASTYDEYGSLTERCWYHAAGSPAAGPDGAEVLRDTYDPRGLLLREAFYNAKGAAVVDHRGIHQTLLDYNDKRQQTKWQVFGLKRAPVEDEQGDHLVISDYDERGRRIRTTRLRANGGPNLDRELGIATERKTYDKNNNWTEQSFYDAQDRPVSGPDGAAKVTLEAEPDGRIATVLCGTDGKPLFDPVYGYAIKKTDSRTRGDTVDSYHGPDGAPIAGPEGYAEVRRHWDDGGNLLNEAFFGPDGESVAGPNGYHRAELGPGGEFLYFDAGGRQIDLSVGSEIEAVIAIKKLLDSKTPAAKAGIQAGDILWRYGDWYLPAALASERAASTASDTMFQAVADGFLAARSRLAGGEVPATVVRHGRLVALSIPPLPDGSLGAELVGRMVPTKSFQSWQSADAVGSAKDTALPAGSP